MIKHISEKQWNDFWENRLSQEEKSDLLAHVEKCDYCAAKMAESLPEEKMLTPQPKLRENTRMAISKYRVRVKIMQKTELLRYSLKVSLAAGCALFLLFSKDILGFSVMYAIQTDKFSEMGTYLWETTLEFNEKINSTLYHNYLESEGFDDEKAEK